MLFNIVSTVAVALALNGCKSGSADTEPVTEWDKFRADYKANLNFALPAEAVKALAAKGKQGACEMQAEAQVARFLGGKAIVEEELNAKIANIVDDCWEVVQAKAAA